MSWIDESLNTLLKRNGIDYLLELVAVDFLGKDFMVRNGVVDYGDYDDAWMLAIAFDSRNIFDVG